MKTLSKISIISPQVTVVFLALFILGQGQMMDDKKSKQNTKTDQMADWLLQDERSFDKSQSEIEKLLAAIAIIEKGKLHRGVDIETVDKLFSTKFSQAFPLKSQNPSLSTWRVIDFRKPIDPPDHENPTVATVFQGWYLAIKLSANGMVIDYYVSNVHK